MWREMICFCSCVDDLSIWWQMFNFICLPLKRLLQLNSRIVRTYFASIMTLNNWEMFAETSSYNFRWRSDCRWRRLCLRFLIGNFRAHLSLHFKARLNAKSLLWKSVFIHIKIGTNYQNKNFALRLVLKERLRGTRKCSITGYRIGNGKRYLILLDCWFWRNSHHYSWVVSRGLF